MIFKMLGADNPDNLTKPGYYCPHCDRKIMQEPTGQREKCPLCKKVFTAPTQYEAMGTK